MVWLQELILEFKFQKENSDTQKNLDNIIAIKLENDQVEINCTHNQ